MVIAVDYDGTITKKNTYPEVGELKPFVIEALNILREDGHKLILWTCRKGKELQEAVDFLKENGFEFDAVNEQIYNYNTLSQKVCADMYIDDAAYPFVAKDLHFWENLIA